jgi:hypothetical protein
MKVHTNNRKNPPVLKALPMDWKDPDARAGRYGVPKEMHIALRIVLGALGLGILFVLVAGIFIL